MNYSTRDGEMGYDFYFHSFYFPSHALDFSHIFFFKIKYRVKYQLSTN